MKLIFGFRFSGYSILTRVWVSLETSGVDYLIVCCALRDPSFVFSQNPSPEMPTVSNSCSWHAGFP